MQTRNTYFAKNTQNGKHNLPQNFSLLGQLVSLYILRIETKLDIQWNFLFSSSLNSTRSPKVCYMNTADTQDSLSTLRLVI